MENVSLSGASIGWELAAFERRLAVAEHGAPDPAEPIEAGQDKLLALLMRSRWAIAAIVLGSLAGGMVFHLSQTPLFRATARIELMAPAARVIAEMAPVAQTADLRLFQTAIEKLRSRAVAERAGLALELANDPAFGGNEGPEAEDRVTDAVRRGLSVSLLRNTAILAVGFEHADPAVAARVANGLADAFIAMRREETSAASDVARRFLGAQAEGAKTRLAASEGRLLAYAASQNIAASGEGGSLVAQNIAALNASLGEAIAARTATETEVARIAAGAGGQLREVLENATLLDLKGRTVALRAEYRQKLATFKPDFPAMRTLRAEIGEYEAQSKALTDAVLRSVEARHEEAKLRETHIRTRLAGLETDQRVLSEKAVPLSILRREADADRTQYEGLIAKLGALGVGASLEGEAARVIDPASPPNAPVGPGLARTLLAALLLGGGCAALWVMLCERLGGRLRWPTELEDRLGLPVLAALPLTPRRRIAAALRDERSALGEAYRSLRGTLLLAGFRGPPRTLLVTSAGAGEGKTTTASALAGGFAALGHRTLLVECDLRRPVLAAKLGLAQPGGLSSILSGQVERRALPELFQPVARNLSVLCAGPPAASPADLLSSVRMVRLGAALARRFDVVVLDGPPVLGLADAPVLARLADATLLVVGANSTSPGAAAQALKRLRGGGGRVVGAALTRFRPVSAVERRLYAYPQTHRAKAAMLLAQGFLIRLVKP